MPDRRVFFGLALPGPLQQQLVHWRTETFPAEAGHPVAAASLHLTLAFIGEVSREKCRALSLLASRIRQPGFTLRLDDAGHWPRSGVVWLGCQQAPRGLVQLADLLRAQAARNGCHQSPQPFHPHITLLRHARRPVTLPPRGFHWQFEVTHFTLFSALTTQRRPHYEPLEQWPLAPSR